ncbi:MAG: hypothetical protein NTX05_01600 [Fusobacteria bacterium]|nr:hypothetical protein [Fusobacteriota bacterium]
MKTYKVCYACGGDIVLAYSKKLEQYIGTCMECDELFEVEQETREILATQPLEVNLSNIYEVYNLEADDIQVLELKLEEV